MAGHRSKYFPLIAICIDVILLFNAFLTAALIVFRGSFPHPVFYWKLFSVWVLLWIVVAIQLKLFDLPRIFYTDRTVLKNIQALLVFTVLSAALIYFVADYQFSKLYFVLAISLFGVMLLTWHLMLTVLFKAYRKKGNNYRNIVLVGFNEQVEYLTREVLLQPENGYRIAGIFGGACPEDLRPYHKGTEAAVLEHLAEGGIDEMLISLPAEQADLMNTYMSYADNHLIRARILPHFSGYLFQKFSLEYVLNLPVMELRREPLESLSNRIVKRVFDILFSLAVLIFIGSWLFPVIALLIKLTSKGPVFFIQERSGKKGIPFNCIKFRTMCLNSDSDKKQTTRNDARITAYRCFFAPYQPG